MKNCPHCNSEIESVEYREQQDRYTNGEYARSVSDQRFTIFACGSVLYPLDEVDRSVRCCQDEIARLRDALETIKRHCQEVSINNGTSTLGLFCDMVLDPAAARSEA